MLVDPNERLAQFSRFWKMKRVKRDFVITAANSGYVILVVTQFSTRLSLNTLAL